MSAEASPSVPAPGPLGPLDAAERATLTTLADHLIPEAHGMPSAGDVIGDARLQFVLNARPDLIAPLRAALRPELPDEPAARLVALGGDRPDVLASLFLVIVGAYYTDEAVRERLGYPGQQAIQIYSWKYPEYMKEGLIDGVLARGPIWRDPSTGGTAVENRPAATTPADRGA